MKKFIFFLFILSFSFIQPDFSISETVTIGRWKNIFLEGRHFTETPTRMIMEVDGNYYMCSPGQNLNSCDKLIKQNDLYISSDHKDIREYYKIKKGNLDIYDKDGYVGRSLPYPY